MEKLTDRQKYILDVIKKLVAKKWLSTNSKRNWRSS